MGKKLIMNILETIVQHKALELEVVKKTISEQSLKLSPFYDRECFSLRKFLSDPERTGIIAEFKRKSPSKGLIHPDISPHEVVPYYAISASAISVLTETEFFGGDLEDLRCARRHCKIPLLRKDFMIDVYQLLEAKASGADVILLIASCLSKQKVSEMAISAHQLGLEVLLEIHDEDEIGHICPEVDVVGINNRNLKDFSVDWKHSFALRNKIASDKMVIAESGIKDYDTIESLRKEGFNGFLIGETFMRTPNPGLAYQEFVSPKK